MTRIAPGSPSVYPMLTPQITPGQLTANANVGLTDNSLLLNASATANSPFNPLQLQQSNPFGINTLLSPPPTNSLITDSNANPLLPPSLYSTSLPPVNSSTTGAGNSTTTSSTTLPPYMANINLNNSNPFLLGGNPLSPQPETAISDPNSLISDPSNLAVKQTSEASANGSNATANAININSTVNFSFNPVFMLNQPAANPTPNPSPAATAPGNPLVPGPYPNLLANVQPPVTTPASPNQKPMAAPAAALTMLNSYLSNMKPASGMTNTQAAKLLMAHMDELDGAADANQGNKDNVFSINDLLMVGANRGGKYSPEMVQAANQLLNSPEIRIKLSTGPNGIFPIDDLALLAKDDSGNVVPTNYMTTIMQQPDPPYTGTGFAALPEETSVATKKKDKKKEDEKNDPTVTDS